MIVQQLVVVADAHLNAAAAVDEAAFLAFLDAAPSLGDSLLLAGDIYDFWYSYQHLIPRHCVRVTARIIELARRMPVLMIGGNHDRWGDTFWSPQTDVIFDRRQLSFNVGGRRALAIHGDGLHEEKRTAAALNRLLDAPAMVRLFGRVPASLGFYIAGRLGHDPVHTAAHPEIVDLAAARQLAWARTQLHAATPPELVIMGHTHRSALEELVPGHWYVNPGAWLGEHRFAVVGASAIELQAFR